MLFEPGIILSGGKITIVFDVYIDVASSIVPRNLGSNIG